MGAANLNFLAKDKAKIKRSDVRRSDVSQRDLGGRFGWIKNKSLG